MAWTAITHAFLSSQIDSVIAGTDLPNAASVAVIRRLGMRFHKKVQYPLGAGVGYVIHQDNLGLLPKPVLIPIEADSDQTKSRRQIIKEIVGIHVLLRRSLFGDRTLRTLFRRVSPTEPISAALQL
jgi:hypothetical protein